MPIEIGLSTSVWPHLNVPVLGVLVLRRPQHPLLRQLCATMPWCPASAHSGSSAPCPPWSLLTLLNRSSTFLSFMHHALVSSRVLWSRHALVSAGPDDSENCASPTWLGHFALVCLRRELGPCRRLCPTSIHYSMHTPPPPPRPAYELGVGGQKGDLDLEDR